MRSITTKYFTGCTISAMLLLAMACSKIAVVPNDNAEQPKFSDKSKVLLIVVDGLSGREMKKIKPPVISGLLPHSTYSYDGNCDTITTDGASWGNIMTGTGIGKNDIWDSTLTPRTQSGARYASFLSLVKNAGLRRLKAISVTGWEQLNKTLLADAGIKINVAGGDAAVKDSAVNRLAKDSIDIMITHFSSVNKAGIKAGFDAASPEYAAAVTNVDAYIGDLIGALKARPDYASENWLVMVQSTHGGVGKAYGGRTDEEMNTFSLFYNPDLLQNEVGLPQAIKYGVHMYEQNAAAVNAVLEDNSAYNLGASGSFTLETKMRTYTAGFTATYPAFFSKRPQFVGNSPGWCMFLEGNYWQINFGTLKASNKQCKGAVINDAKWHHLTATIYTDAAKKRWVTTYTDGVKNNTADITSIDDLNSTAPLTLGFIPGSVGKPMDLYMSDVRIWNDTLPAAVISKYSCTNVIDNTHPYYAKLIGYWPCQEGRGGVIRNQAPGAVNRNFNLQGGYKWDFVNYVLPCQGNVGVYPAIQSKEVFSQIAYWLNLQVNAEWEIDARLWLKFF